ncbi:MAG: N-acetylmuramoyl-L-alanine amidase family 2 [Anaerospora sp.]|nr:N-acetylmuramoyl-L-alanine amidase [Anaerospora sp.]MDF2928663.1 N-acetylmuramoyl-L-alanine amidase family 2 [Anaerospora sp.]
MEKVTLRELEQLALQAKSSLENQAQSIGRDVMIYLHWTAGHYGQFFTDYHINIDADGSIYASMNDLSEVKSHTYRRNTGAVGIGLCCAYNAVTNDLGAEPPTAKQIEVSAQVVAALAQSLDLTIDYQHVMTHAEAADEDGYGPATTCERWDLWFFDGVAQGEGGNVIRGKANWYLHSSDRYCLENKRLEELYFTKH